MLENAGNWINDSTILNQSGSRCFWILAISSGGGGGWCVSCQMKGARRNAGMLPCEMEISINGGTPKWMVYTGKPRPVYQCMIEGYPYFRKPRDLWVWKRKENVCKHPSDVCKAAAPTSGGGGASASFANAAWPQQLSWLWKNRWPNVGPYICAVIDSWTNMMALVCPSVMKDPGLTYMAHKNLTLCICSDSQLRIFHTAMWVFLKI